MGMPQRAAKSGPASLAECPPRTLIEAVIQAAKSQKDQPWAKVERPVPQLVDNVPPAALPEEEWTTWTYGQLLDDTKAAAKALIKLGFMPFDSVNIWGFNTPEWMISSFAAQFAGGKAAGIYPTDTEDTAAYKVVHSGGRVIVVEDESKIVKLAKGMAARGADTNRVKAIVCYGFEPGESVAKHWKGTVLSWKAFIEMGRAQDESELNNRISKVTPGQCAALIYTSGTTGDPKAVMISHDNLNFECDAVFGLLKKSVGLDWVVNESYPIFHCLT